MARLVRRGETWWAGLLVLCCACCTSSDGDGDPASDAGSTGLRGCEPGEPALTCARYLNIAHRGGALLRPENTMVAFEHAVTLGVDVLELDAHASSDGVIVVIHDDEVDRTTDGTGEVSSLTLAELQALDAGYDFTTDGGASFPYRGSGIVIPTLEQVLSSLSDQWFMLEVKQSEPSIVDGVLAVIDATGTAERVMLASMHDAVLLEIRAARPELMTSMGAGEGFEFINLPPESEASYEPPAPALQPMAGLVDAPLMSKADRTDVAVHAWTVNDSGRMAELLAIHVHGIITDDPATLQELLEQQGL